jgi:hypothetical protein
MLHMSNQDDEDMTSDLGKTSQKKRKHGTFLLRAGNLNETNIESYTSGSDKKAIMASKTISDTNLNQ